MESQPPPGKHTAHLRRPPKDGEFYTINNEGKWYQEDDSETQPELQPYDALSTTRHQIKLNTLLEAYSNGQAGSEGLFGLAHRLSDEVKEQQRRMIDKAAAIDEDVLALKTLIQAIHDAEKIESTDVVPGQTSPLQVTAASTTATSDKLYDDLTNFVEKDDTPIQARLRLFVDANEKLQSIMNSLGDCKRLLSNLGKTNEAAETGEAVNANERSRMTSKMNQTPEDAITLPYREKPKESGGDKDVLQTKEGES